MTINHRCSVRIPLRLEVGVYHRGRTVGGFITRNVDPDGAFVEGSDFDLRQNDFIELEFEPEEDKAPCLRQKGLVVHRNLDGIGVFFAHDLAGFRALLATLVAGAASAHYPSQAHFQTKMADQARILH